MVESKISSKLTALIALWLVAPSVSRAGPLRDLLAHRQPDCPAPSYSPLHYWAPNLYRLHAHHPHGSEAFAPSPSCPDMPARYHIIRYPCPTIDPAVAAAAYP